MIYIECFVDKRIWESDDVIILDTVGKKKKQLLDMGIETIGNVKHY